jgi:hypothetical protein
MQNHMDKRRTKRGSLTAIGNFTNYRQHNTWKRQMLLHSTDIIFVFYVNQWISPHLIQKMTVLLTYEFRSSVSGSKGEMFLL